MPQDFDIARPPGSFETASTPKVKTKQPEERKTSTIAQKIRNTARWRRLSIRVRQEQPWCADPFGLHRMRREWKPASETHHIIGIEREPSLALSRANLAGVCSGCHGHLEARERAGEATAALFDPLRGRGGVVTFSALPDTPTRSRKKSEPKS